MAKPSLTALVRGQLTSAYVVDVARGPNGSLTVATAIDSPADLVPGRYVMLDTKDAVLALKRLVTIEHATALDRVAKRMSGRHSLKRTQ